MTSRLNLFSFGFLATSLFLWVIAPGFAQETDSTTETTQEPNTTCLSDDAEAGLVIPMLALYQDMVSFLDQHYQAEEPATALLETTLLKFDQFKLDMEDLLVTYAVSQPDQPTDQESEEIQKCINLVYLKIDEVEQLMRNHHLENAGAKTTYTLVTKLKEINDGLRDMTGDFADIQNEFNALRAKLTSVTQ